MTTFGRPNPTCTANVDVLSFSVVDGELVETPSVQPFEFELADSDYINNVHGPQGFPAERLQEAIARGGWHMQFGTRPVSVDGVWGGRNYPEMRVSADELKKLGKGLGLEC